jgi:hypothetical protein
MTIDTTSTPPTPEGSARSKFAERADSADQAIVSALSMIRWFVVRFDEATATGVNELDHAEIQRLMGSRKLAVARDLLKCARDNLRPITKSLRAERAARARSAEKRDRT